MKTRIHLPIFIHSLLFLFLLFSFPVHGMDWNLEFSEKNFVKLEENSTLAFETRKRDLHPYYRNKKDIFVRKIRENENKVFSREIYVSDENQSEEYCSIYIKDKNVVIALRHLLYIYRTVDKTVWYNRMNSGSNSNNFEDNTRENTRESVEFVENSNEVLLTTKVDLTPTIEFYVSRKLFPEEKLKYRGAYIVLKMKKKVGENDLEYEKILLEDYQYNYEVNDRFAVIRRNFISFQEMVTQLEKNAKISVELTLFHEKSDEDSSRDENSIRNKNGKSNRNSVNEKIFIEFSPEELNEILKCIDKKTKKEAIENFARKEEIRKQTVVRMTNLYFDIEKLKNETNRSNHLHLKDVVENLDIRSVLLEKELVYVGENKKYAIFSNPSANSHVLVFVTNDGERNSFFDYSCSLIEERKIHEKNVNQLLVCENEDKKIFLYRKIKNQMTYHFVFFANSSSISEKESRKLYDFLLYN